MDSEVRLSVLGGTGAISGQGRGELKGTGGGHWTIHYGCCKVLPALSTGELNVTQHARTAWAGSTVDGQGPALVWQVHLTSVHGGGRVGIEITCPEVPGIPLRGFRLRQESSEKQKVGLGIYGVQKHRKSGVRGNPPKGGFVKEHLSDPEQEPRV